MYLYLLIIVNHCTVLMFSIKDAIDNEIFFLGNIFRYNAAIKNLKLQVSRTYCIQHLKQLYSSN